MQALNTSVSSTRPTGRTVRRAIILALFAAGLGACGAIDALVDGGKNAKAVETDLLQTAGVRPAVGFNWHNGRLTTVSVTFPKLLEDKPLTELADAVRAAVGRQFKQRADNVVLSFSLGPSTTTAAQAR